MKITNFRCFAPAFQRIGKFVMSKSRLAPIKAITIPRLEVNAVDSGAKLVGLVQAEIDLPIERVGYWSDSILAFQYI